MTEEPLRDWSFVPPGATGPRIAIRRQLGVRPIVTADGQTLRPKWNLRATGVFLYLGLSVALLFVVGRSSSDTLVLFAPLAVGFFLVELPWLGTYAVPLADGTTATLRLKGARRGIRAAIGGQEIPVEGQLPLWAQVLAVLPTVALFAAILIRFAPFAGPHLLGSLGPVLTSVLGILAFAGGQAVVRSVARPGAQLIGIVALTALVAGVEIGVHYGKPNVPVFAAGDCLDVGRSGTLRTTTPTIDCGASHASEVIGAPVLDVEYPGSSKLALLASDRCNTLFVEYVGIDPDRSVLAVGYFAPTKSAWDLGARTVTCIAYRRDGSPLVRSIRGSGL